MDRSQKKNKRYKTFTLLEITLCIAILGLISSLVIWNMKDMLFKHEFHKSIEQVLMEMDKAQILALTYNADLQLDLYKEKNAFFFKVSSDFPAKLLRTSKTVKLKKTVACAFNDKPIENIQLQVYSNGRIEPVGVLAFFNEQQDEGKKNGIELDFSKPLLIKMKHAENTDH